MNRKRVLWPLLLAAAFALGVVTARVQAYDVFLPLVARASTVQETPTPLLTATPGPISQVFEAIQDTYLDAWSSSGTRGTEPYMLCHSNGAKKPLVQFDLSTLPEGAYVTSATLCLTNVRDVHELVSIYIDVYCVVRCWQEASATWIEALTGVPWRFPGAGSPDDHANQLLSSIPVERRAGQLENEYLWNVTWAVRKWVHEGEQNCGLLLVGKQHLGLNPSGDYLFYSSEADVRWDRLPRLVVYYYIPPPMRTPTPWPTCHLEPLATLGQNESARAMLE